MAAPPPILKRALWLVRALGFAFAAIVAAAMLMLALYSLAGWAGSSIPRNAGWEETGDKEASGAITIMVASNGVHTALVLPLVTREKDWRTDFPASDISAPDRSYTHISIGWGERQVFLETPTWRDLSPLTVLRIIGSGGDGLLHVSHYVRPAPSADLRPISLSRAEYGRLVASIEQWVPPLPRVRHDGYGRQDVFYNAPGRYTMIDTCNQWTSDRLAAAGVRTGWWTPFAGSVMKWVPVPVPDTT